MLCVRNVPRTKCQKVVKTFRLRLKLYVREMRKIDMSRDRNVYELKLPGTKTACDPTVQVLKTPRKKVMRQKHRCSKMFRF